MSQMHTLAQVNRWAQNQQNRFEIFVEKANKIHNNKFDYSNVLYTHSHEKVKILCPDHGIFEQRPCDHVNQKQGCPRCSHNMAWSHDNFVSKSKEQYQDKFEIVSEYIGMKHPITISCKDHGNFTLKKAEKHLDKNGGCPSCWYNGRLENLKPGNISKVETAWLDSLKVPLRQHKLIIKNQTFLVDGFDPATNTVYECHGSYWHGNPDMYKASDLNTKVGKTFGELYNQTLAKEKLIRQEYNLVTKWV
ncbi:MAG TPA: DUF723 domain-containing protein [Methanosarcina sp.]|nr:DUF723 domain-containing protein [Methanosarcina sp.]